MTEKKEKIHGKKCGVSSAMNFETILSQNPPPRKLVNLRVLKKVYWMN